MAGRPRLPREAKIIKGTFHKYRNPESEPEYQKPPADAEPPKKLNKRGKELWEKLFAPLAEAGVLADPDLPAFEMLCASYGRYKALEEYVEKDLVGNVEGGRGGTSAQKAQMNAEFAMCEKMMARFGLTPSDRNRIGLSKEKPSEDPKIQRMKELVGA